MKKKDVGAKAPKLSKPEVDLPGIAKALGVRGRVRDVMKKTFSISVA